MIKDFKKIINTFKLLFKKETKKVISEPENGFITRETQSFEEIIKDKGAKMMFFLEKLLDDDIEVCIIKTAEDLRKVTFYRKIPLSNKTVSQDYFVSKDLERGDN